MAVGEALGWEGEESKCGRPGMKYLPTRYYVYRRLPREPRMQYTGVFSPSEKQDDFTSTQCWAVDVSRQFATLQSNLFQQIPGNRDPQLEGWSFILGAIHPPAKDFGQCTSQPLLPQ